jgi:anaerobic magnesium-protoporphyrin IX monomethyl ester cyclase
MYCCITTGRKGRSLGSITSLSITRKTSSFREHILDLALRGSQGSFREHVPFDFTPKKTILLLHPPGACSAFTRSGSQYPPLGLLQLKALIGDSSTVDVLEADGLGHTTETTIQNIISEAPRAIGMTVTCGTKSLTNAWSTIVKNLRTEYKPIVIVGGPAAAFETDSIMEACPNVDVVVKGEGEVTFPKIVDILRETQMEEIDIALTALARLPGVCVRNRPEMNDSKIPTLPKEGFATLPFPDLSKSPVHRYKAPDAKRLPMVTIMTQRGCIAKCAFCNTPQIHGNAIRGWSNEQIIEELKRLKEMHGLKEVSFVDDVFTNRPGGPRKLCELMIQEGLDLTWYCNVRADQVTTKMAWSMKAAGCHQVFMGFESGCDAMLKRINKGETVADLERGANIMKEAGIYISIGFIVGLPGETQDSVDKTIELCNRVMPNRVQFTRFTPIPGSLLAASHHDITSEGFHDRSSPDQVEEWIRQCYEACNYKPSV